MSRRIDCSIDWSLVKAACVRRGVLGDPNGVRPLLLWVQDVIQSTNADPDEAREAFEVVTAAALEFDRLEAGVTQSPVRPGAARRYRDTHRFVTLNPDEAARIHTPWIERACMTYNEWEQEVEIHRDARRAENRRRVERIQKQYDRPLSRSRALAIDEAARESLAVAAGARLANGIARGVQCPSCSRRSLWWAVAKGWAYCDHKNSCEWSGPLDIVADAIGVEAGW